MQFCSEGLGEMRVFNLQLRCSFATFALSADPQWGGAATPTWTAWKGAWQRTKVLARFIGGKSVLAPKVQPG